MLNKLTKPQIIYPDEIVPLVRELLEKHGIDLEKRKEEIAKKIKLAKTLEEKVELFRSLPIGQVSKTIKEIVEQRMPIEEMSIRLKERLLISEKKANDLAEDIKKKVIYGLGLIEKEPSIKTKPSSKREAKKDIYREPIE